MALWSVFWGRVARPFPVRRAMWSVRRGPSRKVNSSIWEHGAAPELRRRISDSERKAGDSAHLFGGSIWSNLPS